MKNLIINWCKVMFTQTSGCVRVRTASCRNGVVSAIRRQDLLSEEPEMLCSIIPTASPSPIVSIEENTVYLTHAEASFVHKEVRRLLKNQQVHERNCRQAGIPLPPKPGKIAYAVYQ